MQLHRLKLVNFRQHAESELVFGAGLTAVVGPNGVGKTTLLEALAWALYGNMAARGSRDSIRRSSAPPRAPVRAEVDFSLGPHEYRVARSLYGAELYQDGGETPIANSHQAVTEKIGRLLAMTYDEFFNTYFTGQKELTVMAGLGPTDRGKFLSRLLGYEKLRRAQQHLRQRRSVLRAEGTGLEQGLEDLERLRGERGEAERRLEEIRTLGRGVKRERSGARRAVRDAAPAWERMRRLREENLAADGERRIAEQMEQEARREFERLDRELAEAITANDQLEKLGDDLARAAGLRAEMEHLDRESQAADRRRILSGQFQEVLVQTERLQERLRTTADVAQDHERAEVALRRARKTLDDLREREEHLRTTWVRDKQDAETKRLALLEQYSDLDGHRKRIVEAGPDGRCPTCARPLGSEYESVLESLAGQLEEIKANGKYYKSRVRQLAGEPKELSSVEHERQASGKQLEEALQQVAESETKVAQRRESESELGRLGERIEALKTELAQLPDRYDAERHAAVRKELKRLAPVLQKGTELRVKAEHAERLVPEAETAERRLSECEERVRQLRDAIAESGYTEEGYQEARDAYERAETALRNAELRAAQIEGDEKASRAGLDGIERRMREREAKAARIAELRRDLDLHDELDAALEDLRGDLNAKLRPDLADLGSSFAADLTDGRYTEFELDENYQIRVVDDGVPKPVISGGEEDLFNLALRLAISQMVAERAGQPLSLLVLDEIFGGLDESRRAGVLALLRRLSDRFPQVVLITHIESVKEGADQVLRVALDERTRNAVVMEEHVTEQFAYVPS